MNLLEKLSGRRATEEKANCPMMMASSKRNKTKKNYAKNDLMGLGEEEEEETEAVVEEEDTWKRRQMTTAAGRMTIHIYSTFARTQ